MAFSYGDNFFNDLLKKSDKIVEKDHLSSNDSIKIAYDLQTRLANFWVNNNKPVLMKSQKYSGMNDSNGNATPLGGPINWLEGGARNAPSSVHNGCPNEFPFWGHLPKHNKHQENKEYKEHEDNKIEHFTDNGTDNGTENFINKENFDEKDTLLISGIVVVVILILLMLVMFYFHHKSMKSTQLF